MRDKDMKEREKKDRKNVCERDDGRDRGELDKWRR